MKNAFAEDRISISWDFNSRETNKRIWLTAKSLNISILPYAFLIFLAPKTQSILPNPLTWLCVEKVDRSRSCLKPSTIHASQTILMSFTNKFIHDSSAMSGGMNEYPSRVCSKMWPIFNNFSCNEIRIVNYYWTWFGELI